MYLTGSDARRMWQGLQTITDNKGKHSRELPSDIRLPDELNNLSLPDELNNYARIEASNSETSMREPAVSDECVITLSAADGRSTFTRPLGQTEYQDVFSEDALAN